MMTATRRSTTPKRPRGDGANITFRCAKALADQLTALVKFEKAMRPGASVSLADVIRQVLIDGLAARAARKQEQ